MKDFCKSGPVYTETLNAQLCILQNHSRWAWYSTVGMAMRRWEVNNFAAMPSSILLAMNQR